ncbi:MAG TPA: hypothetical protein VEA63_04935, partial [Opitutus sp.]|nr:hypothetical protein [Opitutus sp.]
SLLAVIGAGLAMAAWRERLTAEWIFLAAAAPLVLAIVDIVFVTRDVIPPIYLADAAGELALAALWCVIAIARVQNNRAGKTR